MQIRHEPRADERRLCGECRWSRMGIHSVWGSTDGTWRMECTHHLVLAEWAIDGRGRGVACVDERARRRVGVPCGVGAKLWEART